MNRYGVAVCIPCFEFAEGLTRTLNDLRKQVFTGPWRDFQVVLVDDSLSDDVERLALIYGAPSQLNLKYIRRKYQLGARVASASNIAWLSADVGPEDLLIFTDSHILIGPDWVEKHLTWHEGHDKRVVLGPYRDDSWDGPSNAGAWPGNPRDRFKMMRFYSDSLRKKHLTAVGGWDEDFDGEYGFEDVDLAYRLQKQGLEFVRGDNVEVVHLRHPRTHPVAEGQKPGLRNVRLLAKKHPELAYMQEAWER